MGELLWNFLSIKLHVCFAARIMCDVLLMEEDSVKIHDKSRALATHLYLKIYIKNSLKMEAAFPLSQTQVA
jgi:hypothetical protein